MVSAKLTGDPGGVQRPAPALGQQWFSNNGSSPKTGLDSPSDRPDVPACWTSERSSTARYRPCRLPSSLPVVEPGPKSTWWNHSKRARHSKAVRRSFRRSPIDIPGGFLGRALTTIGSKTLHRRHVGRSGRAPIADFVFPAHGRGCNSSEDQSRLRPPVQDRPIASPGEPTAQSVLASIVVPAIRLGIATPSRIDWPTSMMDRQEEIERNKNRTERSTQESRSRVHNRPIWSKRSRIAGETIYSNHRDWGSIHSLTPDGRPDTRDRA